MNLKQQAEQFVKTVGSENIAAKLGVQESTVKVWVRSGRYPMNLLELMFSQTPGPESPSTATQVSAPSWSGGDLDALGEYVQDLDRRLKDLEERHNPRPTIPQRPAATVPPGQVEGVEHIVAQSTHPFPQAPTPRPIGDAPPAVTPPAPVTRGWLEPYTKYQDRRR